MGYFRTENSKWRWRVFLPPKVEIFVSERKTSESWQSVDCDIHTEHRAAHGRRSQLSNRHGHPPGEGEGPSGGQQQQPPIRGQHWRAGAPQEAGGGKQVRRSGVWEWGRRQCYCYSQSRPDQCGTLSHCICNYPGNIVRLWPLSLNSYKLQHPISSSASQPVNVSKAKTIIFILSSKLSRGSPYNETRWAYYERTERLCSCRLW